MFPLEKILDSDSIPGLDGKESESAKKLCALLVERFSAARHDDVTLGFVPGRVEIAGKHTDYAGGHTLVCAINRGFLFAAIANSKGTVRMVEDSTEFEELEFPLTQHITPSTGSWANYPMTMGKRVAANFGDKPLRGVDVAFSSSLPVGSGMSGSSALMMMCFCAIATVNQLNERKKFWQNIRDGVDLAMYLACAENGQSFRTLSGGKGVGTFGGSEDHTAILNCREGALSLYQYSPTVLKAELRWPSEWAIVLAFSGVRAEKTKQAMDQYNLASRRAFLSVAAYNQLYGRDMKSLQAIDADTRGIPEARWLRELEASVEADRSLNLPGRIRQFLNEERRTTPKAVHGLLWRDIDAFGTAVSASHRTSRRYLRNITPEVDFLQSSALALGAAGASAFGAGFGGSLFAVLPSRQKDSFISAWERAYQNRYTERARDAVFFAARPTSGITLWNDGVPTRFADLFL